MTCVVAFDLLQLEGQDVMPEPWTDRRKRLEDLAATLDSKQVGVAPVTDDAARLWALWVGEQGGEGIVLKARSAPYRPGRRSSAWLKVKERLILDVLVEDGNPELIRWGE